MRRTKTDNNDHVVPRGEGTPGVAGQGTRPSKAELELLIEEVTEDAYGEFEQMTGFTTMLDQHLALPFQTRLLGVKVMVERIDLARSDVIVAIGTRGQEWQAILLLDLPLPRRRPAGAERIAAFRCRAKGQ